MIEKLDKRLLDLKARQRAGEHMNCPRCGRDTMKPDVYTNALSRLEDIMVCDECGHDEAKLAYMRVPGTLYLWAAFQPKKPPSDFKARAGSDVKREIEETQYPYLAELYDRWLKRTEDEEALRFESYETCKGLSELWFEPFQAAYDVSDGRLLIRFRRTDTGVQLAADLIPGK